MEIEGMTSEKVWLHIKQLGSAEELVCFKLALEGKLASQITKILSEEVRARNAIAGGPAAETAAAFAVHLGQVISSVR